MTVGDSTVQVSSSGAGSRDQHTPSSTQHTGLLTILVLVLWNNAVQYRAVWWVVVVIVVVTVNIQLCGGEE